SRPYFNSTDPSAPIFQNNYDTRTDLCVIEIKLGTEAASPTPPVPDAGFTGLYYVTVNYGQTSIVSGNITVVPNAPFITEGLTQKISQTTANNTFLTKAQLQNPAGISYAIDVSTTPNVIELNGTPPYPAPAIGQTIQFEAASTITGTATVSINGNIPINIYKNIPVNAAGAPSGIIPTNYGDIAKDGKYTISYNGSVWILENPSNIHLLYAKVGFDVSTTQIIAANTSSVIQFNHVIYDPNKWWNAGGHYFAPNIKGSYRATVKVAGVNANAGQQNL